MKVSLVGCEHVFEHFLKVATRNFLFLLILAAPFETSSTTPAPAFVKIFAFVLEVPDRETARWITMAL